MKLPKEVFFSHATQDHRMARRVREVVVAYKVRVWISSHHIRGADEWHDEIGKALSRCDWFMLLLSPAAVRSMWVKRELHFALEEKRYDNRIIPLLYKDCDSVPLSWALSQFQRIDLRKNFWKGCADLLRIWGITLDSKIKKQFKQK
jgi:hypothetical protein